MQDEENARRDQDFERDIKWPKILGLRVPRLVFWAYFACCVPIYFILWAVGLAGLPLAALVRLCSSKVANDRRDIKHGPDILWVGDFHVVCGAATIAGSLVAIWLFRVVTRPR